jgi:hypothetical protein
MWVQFGPGGPELFGRLKPSSSEVTGPVAEVTITVGGELVVVVPLGLAALSITSTVDPTSADPSAYLDAVAPGIAVQFRPFALQSCHW